jgi:hypothetical protein
MLEFFFLFLGVCFEFDSQNYRDCKHTSYEHLDFLVNILKT